MKKTNRILFAATVAVAFLMAYQANAQSQAVGPDGITASPRVRQLLNERRAAAATTPAPILPVAAQAPSEGVSVTASPRVRQMLDAQKKSGATSTAGMVASYRAVGPDGITASPKVREQLNERAVQFQIAPVK